MTDAIEPPPYPRATYRLQFNRDFGFEEARALAPYLAELGVSHVYASPLLMARPGSTHGYDIVDHNRFNPEIGDEAAFDALVGDLRRRGVGMIVDFVPNHMGVGLDNPWWVDVLEWGRLSPYADFFDIDWNPLESTLDGKVLLPVLGDHYGSALERGELRLSLDVDRGQMSVCYFDNAFPLAPREYPWFLAAAAARTPRVAPLLRPLIADLEVVLRDRRLRQRHASLLEIKDKLARLFQQEQEARDAVSGELGRVNGDPDDPASFGELHKVLERQAYRLAFWRVAANDINYRRFFDINDLAAVAMERPQVFEPCHRLIGRLIGENKIQGVRLDHIDGLRDPKAYLERLRDFVASLRPASEEGERAHHDGATGLPNGFYVIVEKILAPHESLRKDWQVDGTTGYEAMAAINNLLVDQSGERRLSRYYQHFTGDRESYESIVVAAKRQTIRASLASELNSVAHLIDTRIAKQSRHTRDYTLTSLREALSELAAHFPVYRTYVDDDGASTEDRRDLDWALSHARRATDAADLSIYDFISDVLTLDLLKKRRGEYKRRDLLAAAQRFQQFTSPLMAKSVEDTAFYRYVRLASLNEVGGEPGRFGVTLGAYHEANRRRARDFPFSMVTTSTHDHKRGEDARARLAVLSEVPAEWAHRVRRWGRLNGRKRATLDTGPAPRAHDEYLFYQTLVGAWPLELSPPDFVGLDAFRERVRAYMLKAAREAKARTSWAKPDDAYEKALLDFVDRALDAKFGRSFLEDLHGFVQRIAPAAVVNGLTQTLLKLTSPGTPDLYQGSELWDFSLVDPDNRRPVDFAARAELLRRMTSGNRSPREMLEEWIDGGVKQLVAHRALAYRKRFPALFAGGAYEPLKTTGDHAERIVAFARRRSEEIAVVVAARIAAPMLPEGGPPLPTGWGDTAIVPPEGVEPDRLRFDALALRRITAGPDGAFAAAAALDTLPVAMLVPE